jgi:hypothetical protein
MRFMTLDRPDCIPLRKLLLPGWGYHMMVDIDASRFVFRLGKTSGTPQQQPRRTGGSGV